MTNDNKARKLTKEHIKMINESRNIIKKYSLYDSTFLTLCTLVLFNNTKPIIFTISTFIIFVIYYSSKYRDLM